MWGCLLLYQSVWCSCGVMLLLCQSVGFVCGVSEFAVSICQVLFCVVLQMMFNCVVVLLLFQSVRSPPLL